MNILITSGGTSVPIDNVRSIKNFSSGKFGCNIAKHLLLKGHNVTHLHAIDAPTPFEFKVDLLKPHQDYVSMLDGLHGFSKKYMKKYTEEKFDTFASYHIKMMGLLLNFQYDIIILCAAVSDFLVDQIDGKISSVKNMELAFKKAPKILDIVRYGHKGKLVGFKLLSNVTLEDLYQAAQKQINESGSDIVIANRLEDIQGSNKICYYIKKDSYLPIEGSSDSVASVIAEMVTLDTEMDS